MINPLIPLYLRGMVKRGSYRVPGSVLPPLEISRASQVFPADELASYRTFCGLPNDAEGRVGMLFPLVASLRFQLELLTDPKWPLRPAGLVHLGVSITQYQSPKESTSYTLSCSVHEQELTHRGQEFVLRVRCLRGEEVLWLADSRILSRQSGPQSSRNRQRQLRVQDTDGPDTQIGAFEAPAHTGRQYAWVSGDWNPIHLGWLGARLLGMDRPIAHGMWTLARTLGVMQIPIYQDHIELQCTFRSPLKLPGEALVFADPPAAMVRRFHCVQPTPSRRILDGHVRVLS